MKKGFTLIEMAIVLVIISGFIGVVLGGQSLIEGSKRQSIIKEINQYKTAINNFVLEYNYLPGDFPDATDYWGQLPSEDCDTDAGEGTETCDGDGDGKVDYPKDGNSGSDNPHEMWKAWEHLFFAGYIAEEMSGIYRSGGCNRDYLCTDPDVNAPQSGIGEGSSWHLYYSDGDIASGNPGKAEARNLLMLGSPWTKTHNGAMGRMMGYSLRPRQAKWLDEKIDDGISNTGEVTIRAKGNAVSLVNPECATIVSGTNYLYDTSYADLACTMLIDID